MSVARLNVILDMQVGEGETLLRPVWSDGQGEGWTEQHLWTSFTDRAAQQP